MKNSKKILDYIAKIDPKKITSISDLEIREFGGETLGSEERAALEKYHSARNKILRKQKQKESTFHSYFEYYRALSNLVDYKDILNEKFPL
ncbi:MAG: hypothetical protein CMP59_12415 [Flavobacteriales bacterium]|nr:hypothetical protein [Flavobacteriales bacterium]